jgi:hypothetical protein
VLPRSNGRLSHALRRHPLGRGSKAEHSRNPTWRSNQRCSLVWRRASALFYFPVSAIGTPGILWVLRGSLDLICLSFSDLMNIPTVTPVGLTAPMLKKSTFVLASVAFLGLLILPFFYARNTPSANSCLNNLRQIDGSKQQWAMDYSKTTNDLVAWDDIRPYLSKRGALPVCPGGGIYTLGRTDRPATCSIAEHQIQKPHGAE